MAELAERVRRLAAIDVDALPSGRSIRIPDRGRTWIRDIAGPPGAPTVVLLHGLFATADLNWATSYEVLSQRFRVVAIDHHGHGRGRRTLRPFRLERCADDSAAVCEELGIERAIVCGYSMGGPLALLFWRRHPELVDGLVLCATARRFNGGHLAEKVGILALASTTAIASLTSRRLRRIFMNALVRVGLPDNPGLEWITDELARHDPGVMAQAIPAVLGFDSRSWTHSIDVPTSVLVTTEDAMVAPWRQRALAEGIPDSHIVECSADHTVIVDAHSDFPARLLEACLAVAARADVAAR
jgi:pimeloyl-ACP methyl ester carboxylesterase